MCVFGNISWVPVHSLYVRIEAGWCFWHNGTPLQILIKSFLTKQHVLWGLHNRLMKWEHRVYIKMNVVAVSEALIQNGF